MWKNNLKNVSWKAMFLVEILRMNVSEYNAFVCFTNHLNVKHVESQTDAVIDFFSGSNDFDAIVITILTMQ